MQPAAVRAHHGFSGIASSQEPSHRTQVSPHAVWQASTFGKVLSQKGLHSQQPGQVSTHLAPSQMTRLAASHHSFTHGVWMGMHPLGGVQTPVPS